MAEKLILVADPGIDTAFATALALHDPKLDVLALAATAGNVSSKQATRNVHVLIEQLDPPRWPKLGEALPVDYDINGLEIHGQDGLGGIEYPCSQLHNIQPSDKLITDLLQLHREEVTILCMGPLTAVATALERDPDLVRLIKRIVCLGGSIKEPGDAGPVSEFHFACDPHAVRHILRSDVPITMIPLDVMRKIIFSPMDLQTLPRSRTGRFLSEIIPAGLRNTANVLGVEGIYLQDVVGVFAVSAPNRISSEPFLVDVETQGELTRGMSVVDRRRRHSRPNVDVVLDIDVAAVRGYMQEILHHTT